MPDTWITDMTHYLDSAGRPVVAPPASRLLAEYLGKIVLCVSNASVGREMFTTVQCRRRPRHRRCDGVISAIIDAELNIVWDCPMCADGGVIHHWQGTLWDQRRSGALH